MKNTHLLLFTISALLAITAVAQDKGAANLRTTHIFPSHEHDPVAITRMMKGGAEIQPDKPFEAGDDWLREISVVIKNVSPRKIIYVSVGAHLPETGAGTSESPRVGGGNAAGQKPEHAVYSALTGQRRPDIPTEPIDLEPNKELVLPIVAERDYAAIKSLIQAKQTLSSVRNCDVWVTTVYFSDGTKWAPASYWRPDEARPGKYVSISFTDWLDMQRNRQIPPSEEK